MNVKRNYSEGSIQIGPEDNDVSPIEIYGKPSDWEKEMDNQITLAINDITNNTNPIISDLGQFYSSVNKFNESPLREVKENMINYIQNLGGDIKNGIATTVQDIVVGQQDYVQNIRKINLVMQKIDGKILDTNLARVYNLSGLTNPNTYEELKEDYLTLKKVTVDQLGFNPLLRDLSYPIAFMESDTFKGGDFTVFENQSFPNREDKTFFLLMARIINDNNKKTDFINQIVILLVRIIVNLKLIVLA